MRSMRVQQFGVGHISVVSFCIRKSKEMFLVFYYGDGLCWTVLQFVLKTERGK